METTRIVEQQGFSVEELDGNYLEKARILLKRLNEKDFRGAELLCDELKRDCQELTKTQ